MDVDEVISKPVGEYSTVGLKAPFYAARKHTVSSAAPGHHRQLQILIRSLGELVWINAEPTNVVLE